MSKNFFRIAALSWTFLIVVISLMSGASLKHIQIIDIIGIDKVGHIFFYTMLSFLWSGVFVNEKRHKFIIIFFCSTLGILMEIFQFYLFIGRTFEVSDAIANMIGVLFGVYLYDRLHFKIN